MKGVKLSSETYYRENGNRVKYVYYDYQNNPSDITVYGYIDGMRVSRSGKIRYRYNPPPALIADNGKTSPEKPVANRYDARYEYKYDDKGRLKEAAVYRSNGEMLGKTVYAYDGNKLEKSWLDADGKSDSKVIDLLDDKSNIIEHSFVYLNSNKPDEVTVYTYQTFDEKGNWTKRTIKSKEVENNGNQQAHYIEYRTITYYR